MLVKYKIVIPILSAIGIITSITGLILFLSTSTTAGLITVIIALIISVFPFILSMLKKRGKTLKTYILSTLCIFIALAVLFFTIIGTVKINSFKSKIDREYDFLLPDSNDSYMEKITNLEKILDLQEATDEYDAAVKKSEEVREKYDRFF